jgi:transcriptional regulator with AAA-type ATPase domain
MVDAPKKDPENQSKHQSKQLRLRVAAYACHEHARESIEAAVKGPDSELKHARLHYYAYFCDIPAIISAPDGEIPNLLAPFIDREIARRTLSLNLPRKSDIRSYLQDLEQALNKFIQGKEKLYISRAYTNTSDLYQLWRRFSQLGPLSYGHMAQQLFTKWKGKKGRKKHRDWEPDDLIIGIDKIVDAQYCANDMKTKLESSLTDAQKLAYVNIFALLYYALMTTAKKHDCLFFVSAPLCTKRTFHGLLIAVIETPSGATLMKRKKKNVRETLRKVLKALEIQAHETYLPTLILSQNSWEEHVLFEYLHGSMESEDVQLNDPTAMVKLPKSLVAFSKYTDRVYSRLASCPEDSVLPDDADGNDLLEQSLIELWARRNLPANDNISAIRESLIFRKLMVASPGMIEDIKAVAKLGLSKPTDAPLPAVLIVAPPGSGKEMMSRLIPLFSKDFWEKPIVTINMGSVLLETSSREGGFIGLLRNLAEGSLKEGGTLVLDELNSLDIAAQPLLLRLLDQGEIGISQTLPSSQTVPPWLVIGLINEDPHRLTLEAIREKFTDHRLFGELLGSALYEYWKKMSRLRDDLYHRIRRSGEIHLTGLNERRHDIPIVFYFRLRQLLRETETMRDIEVFLTNEAMMQLIDRALDWKGNMRKLETVARQLKGIIEQEHLGIGVRVLPIDDTLIKQALRNVGMLQSQSAVTTRNQSVP